MSDLTDFLLARIREAQERADHAKWAMQGEWFTTADDKVDEYVRALSPDRVLAECEAKRRIVERCAKVIADEDGYYREVRAPEVGITCSFILQDMALAFADHPDYREEWRP